MTEVIQSALFPDLTVQVSYTIAGNLRASDGSYTSMTQTLQKLQIKEISATRDRLYRLAQCFSRAELKAMSHVVHENVKYQYQDWLKQAICENRITWCEHCEGRGCQHCDGYGFRPAWWDTNERLIQILISDPILDAESDAIWAAIPADTSAYDAHIILRDWALTKDIVL